MVTNRRNKFPPISQCTLSVVVCENYTALLSKAVRTGAGFLPLHASSLGSSAFDFEPSSTEAPFCGKLLKLVPQRKPLSCENYLLPITTTLWERNKASLEIFFWFLLFFIYDSANVWDNLWWRSWFLLPTNTFWTKLNGVWSFMSLLWHYLYPEKDKEWTI